MSKIASRAVLITGAARRIGRALALDFGRNGWNVAVHCHRSQDEAQALIEDLQGMGVKTALILADLAQESEVQAIFPAAVKALGPIECLINNASLFENDTATTATRASWDAHIETNLRAPFVLTQAFAAQLPAEREGVIINLLDQRVWNLTPYFTTYTLSKAGLWALTQTMALALAPQIRVNAIGPGPALPSIRQTLDQFEQQCRSMPLQRGTSPEEICAAARFIFDAPSMTGQMIALDGGQHLGWAPSAPPLDE